MVPNILLTLESELLFLSLRRNVDLTFGSYALQPDCEPLFVKSPIVQRRRKINTMFSCMQRRNRESFVDAEETVHYHPAPDIGAPDLRQETDEDRKGTTLVELIKIEGCTLGLTISGGVDKNCRPQVSNLRPGSIAHRCDALEVGDFILSVNGIRTSGLRHEEIVNLLKNAGEHVVLEVEYEVPESALQSAFSIQCKRHEILLEKEGKSFGFTLRGGLSLERMKSRALTVTSIRPGGPADRDGHLKNGDRVIAINCFNVAHLSLSETMTMMQECESRTGFLIEYDVSVMDAVQNATGPLLVEIEKIPGVSLGIGLAHSVRNGKRSICIESVAPMGIADRSGAIHVGDHLLAIDGASVDHMSLAEASQLLKSGTGDQIRLEIIPISHIQQKASRELLARKALVPICMPSSVSTPALSLPHSPFGTLQNYGTVKSSGYGGQCSGTLPSRFSNYPCSQRTWTRPDRKQSSSMSVASSTVTSVMPNNQICHTEVVEVILYHDRRGPGITLAGGIFSTSLLSEPPVISYVDPGSAADRCGVIQEGDRIISVNGQELLDKTFDEANQLLKDSGSRCLLEIEYDVTESVLPSSGTFVVKLPQRSYGLGITVNAPNNRKSNDPLVITDVRKGSVANRCGSIQPGDKLLSINNVRMESCSAEDAANLLDSADDIIKLKLRRDDPYGDDDNDDCVTYTVELQKRGGVLGITISGTDSPLDPIMISGLIEGGLADRTGAIHVGDRLLAINGNPTKGKTLSEAINMLQVAGDLVTLKISRTVEAKPKNRYNSGKRGFSPVLESPAQTPTIQYPPWQPTPPLPPLSSSTQRSHHRCRRHDNNHHLSQQQRHHSNANHSPYTRGRHRSTGDENNVSPYEAERFAAMTTTEAGKRRQNLRAMERDDPNHHPATPIPSVDSALESWGSSGLENYNQNSTSQAMVLAEPKNGVNKRTRDKSATLPADFRDYHNSVESFSDAECSTNGHQNHRNYTDDDDEEDDDEDDWDANSNASYGSSEDEWSRTCDDLENTDTSEMLRQIGASLRQRSVASLNRIRSRDARRRNKKSNCHCAQGEDAVSSSSHGSNRYSKNNNNATSKPTTGKELVPTTFEEHVQTIFSPTPIQLHRFKLQKDSATDDFGFSLSEGMYEKGVYISAVRVDSLAEKCGLQSYDRILQVNSIKTRDFDCQMAVPLISEAGNNLDLVVSRNPLASSEENGELLLKDERINHDNNSINQKPIKTSV